MRWKLKPRLHHPQIVQSVANVLNVPIGNKAVIVAGVIVAKVRPLRQPKLWKPQQLSSNSLWKRRMSPSWRRRKIRLNRWYRL